jgi:hypothetical protein
VQYAVPRCSLWLRLIPAVTLKVLIKIFRRDLQSGRYHLHLGTAKVTNGDKTFLVTENESTYIPVGIVHALENPGKLPLEMIEIQSGLYLGEDDIVRFADRDGRS